jgi:hypothetical protein
VPDIVSIGVGVSNKNLLIMDVKVHYNLTVVPCHSIILYPIPLEIGRAFMNPILLHESKGLWES